ncbi:MAG: ATP-binding protein [Planctomycetota bacterium]
MSIRTRINLLFVAVLSLAGMSAAGALWAMDRLEAALGGERASHRSQLTAEQLRGEILVSAGDLGLFLSGDPQANARFNATRERMEALLGTLKRNARTAEDLRVAREIESRLKRYSLAARRARKRADDGGQEEAYRLIRKYLDRTLIPEITATIEGLISFHRDRVETTSREAIESRRRIAILIYVSAGLLLMLGGVGFHLVRSWLVTPLGTLGEATRRISRGDYGERVPLEGGDELAQLAREVESMARSIAAFQEQLVEKERLAAVGEMAAAVAHNIRNPLASIRALAQSAQRDPALAGQLKDTLGTIMKTVDRADRWLKDLMISMRPVKIARSMESINRLLRELADASRPYAQRKDVRIDLDLAEELPSLPIDRRKLDQAFISLVTNAVDASSPGMVVTLRSGRKAANSSAVEIVVEDHGPGIEVDLQAKIFSPTFSTKKHGTGIGLSLTRRIILEHQGRIDVDSSPGDGCRMRVSLPFDAPAKEGTDGTDPHS